MINWGDSTAQTVMLMTCTSIDNVANWAYYEANYEHSFSTSATGVSITHTDCCRQFKGVLNENQQHWQFITTIPSVADLTNTGSPATALFPIQDIFVGDPNGNFAVRAKDPDGFPVTYAWATSEMRCGTTSGAILNGNELSQVTKQNFNNMVLDTQTGIVTWNAANTHDGDLFTLGISIVDVAGSYTQIDFFVRTLLQPKYCTQACNVGLRSCNLQSDCCTGNCPTGCDCTGAILPTVTGPDEITVVKDCNVAFSIVGNSGYPGSTVALSATGVPLSIVGWQPNVQMAVPVVQTLTWAPTASDVGSRVVCFRATDVLGLQSKDYCMTLTVSSDSLFLLAESPQSTDVLHPCDAFDLRWYDQTFADTTLGFTNDVTIELCKASTGVCTLIAQALLSALNSKYTWNIPSDIALGTDYTMKYTSSTRPDCCTASVSPVFTIAARPNNDIVVSQPATGVEWQPNCNATVLWADNSAGSDPRPVEIALCNGTATTGCFTFVTNSTPNVKDGNSYNLPSIVSTGLSQGEYTIIVSSLPKGVCSDSFTTPTFKVIAADTYTCDDLEKQNDAIVIVQPGANTSNLGTVIGLLLAAVLAACAAAYAMQRARKRQREQFLREQAALAAYDPNKDFDANTLEMNPDLQSAKMAQADDAIESLAHKNEALRQATALQEAQRQSQLDQLAAAKQAGQRRRGRSEYNELGDDEEYLDQNQHFDDVDF